MATEKASPPKRKTRSCNIEITIERYKYLTKIENEYSEVCSNYKEEQRRFYNAIEKNLLLSDINLKLTEELTFLKEIYRGQMNNIVLQ